MEEISEDRITDLGFDIATETLPEFSIDMTELPSRPPPAPPMNEEEQNAFQVRLDKQIDIAVEKSRKQFMRDLKTALEHETKEKNRFILEQFTQFEKRIETRLDTEIEAISNRLKQQAISNRLKQQRLPTFVMVMLISAWILSVSSSIFAIANRWSIESRVPIQIETVR